MNGPLSSMIDGYRAALAGRLRHFRAAAAGTIAGEYALLAAGVAITKVVAAEMAAAERPQANEDGYAIPRLSLHLVGKLTLTPDFKQWRAS